MTHAYEPVPVPADLEAVVLRCLEKDPAKRYPDASSLEKALGACACASAWGEDEAARWWAEEQATRGNGKGADTDASPWDEKTITTAASG